jgi:hypothetical protein
VLKEKKQEWVARLTRISHQNWFRK